MSKKKFEPGIYVITNLINDKHYVGQTQDLSRREHHHWYYLNKGTHWNFYLQRSYNKYGRENFVFKIIEECPLEKLDEKEIYWIKQYDSIKNGYNSATGGKVNRGHKARLETRLKLSKLRKGKKGNPKTEEEKEKIRLSNIEKWKDESLIEKQRVNNLGEKNPMYNKEPWNKGLKMSQNENELNRQRQLDKWKDEEYSYEQTVKKTNINDKQVIQIVNLLNDGKNPYQISKLLGVGYKSVEKIKKRQGGYGVWVRKLLGSEEICTI